MDIILESIKEETQDIYLAASPGELDLPLELAELNSDSTFSGTARRIEDEVFLDGQLGFALNFTCARCLELFKQEFRVPLHLVIQLVPADRLEMAGEVDDDFVLHPSSQKVYNLNHQVREMIALEVPLKPLCRSDCAGLCGRCGANLNEARCSCSVEDNDPRWEGLRRLLNNNQ